MNKLGKYSRSVSIIGVGCTPFMYTVDNEETNGLTEGEMFGYAALRGNGRCECKSTRCRFLLSW